MTSPELVPNTEGDEERFARAFRELAPGLCAYLTRKVQSASVAEEIVQDLFLAVWRNRETINLDESLAAYLYTAAKNRARNMSRDARVADRVRHVLARAIETDEAAERAADEDVLEMEVAQALNQAVAELPSRPRQVFVLHRRHGKTYRQIAALLGLSQKSVEGAMSRALSRLRERLRPLLG